MEKLLSLLLTIKLQNERNTCWHVLKILIQKYGLQLLEWLVSCKHFYYYEINYFLFSLILCLFNNILASLREEEFQKSKN